MGYYLAGSSFAGKSTTLETLKKQGFRIVSDFKIPNDPWIRMHRGIASLLAHHTSVDWDFCDRSFFDYWVWSKYVWGFKDFPLSWEFVKTTLPQTILVFKRIDVYQVSKERHLPAWAVEKALFLYENAYWNIDGFAAKIYLKENEFLGVDFLDNLPIIINTNKSKEKSSDGYIQS